MTDPEIINELKRLSRRVETANKTLDNLFSDREILEDILTRLTAVENALHLQRATLTEKTKDLKADVNGVQDMVEAKGDEMVKAMDDKTVIVKSPQKSVFQKIMARVGGEKK